MDYDRLNTAAEIMSAFQRCRDAGEEIQLFEFLAEREDPPVDAFVEILKQIKLETVLALTIQAFGKIANSQIKSGLKESEDLLSMLCDRAKSGSSDLIKWSAATAIEQIGFDFIAVSRHLEEKPSDIIAQILNSQLRFLKDLDSSHQEGGDDKDSENRMKFWIYGNTYHFKSATVEYFRNSEKPHHESYIEFIVNSQGIYGIKETNKLLQKLEQKDYPDDVTKNIYENKFFEKSTHELVLEFLKIEEHKANIHLWQNIVHCLQSNDYETRLKAAKCILNIDSSYVDSLYPKSKIFARAIFDCDRSLPSAKLYFNEDLVYEDVVAIIDNLKNAINLVSRDAIHGYFNNTFKSILKYKVDLLPGLSLKQVYYRKKNEEEIERKKRDELEAIERKKRDELEAIERKKRAALETFGTVLSIAVPAALVVLTLAWLFLTETGQSIVKVVGVILILAMLGSVQQSDKDS